MSLSQDTTQVRKGLAAARERHGEEFYLHIADALKGFCGGDLARTGAALWEAFRIGDELHEYHDFAKALARAPAGTYSADDFLRYLCALGSPCPRWVFLDDLTSEPAYRGWTVAFEEMLRVLLTRGEAPTLVTGYSAVRDPIGPRLGLALARHGQLSPNRLPPGSMAQAAEDVVRVNVYPELEPCFEGLDALWSEEDFGRAVVKAALDQNVTRIRSTGTERLDQYRALATDAELTTLVQKLDSAEVATRWYDERLMGFLDGSTREVLAAAGSHHYLPDSITLPFALHVERLAQQNKPVPADYDEAIVEIVCQEREGMRRLLGALDPARRETLILCAAEKKGRNWGMDWYPFLWFPSPGLVRFCIDKCLESDEVWASQASHALFSMGSAAGAALGELLRQRANDETLPNALLQSAVWVLEQTHTPETVAVCRSLLGHRLAWVRAGALKALSRQKLSDLVPEALDALLSSGIEEQELLAATLLVSRSHVAEARDYAASRCDRPLTAALARSRLRWASKLEPELEALLDDIESAQKLHAVLDQAIGQKWVMDKERLARFAHEPQALSAFVGWLLARRSGGKETSSFHVDQAWKALAQCPGAIYSLSRWFANAQTGALGNTINSFGDSLVAARELGELLEAGVLVPADEPAVLWLLARQVPERVVPRLARLLSDGPADEGLKAIAECALIAAGDAAVPTLLEMLATDSKKAPLVAAEILARRPAPEAVELIEKRLRSKVPKALQGPLGAALDVCLAVRDRAKPFVAKELPVLPGKATSLSFDGPVLALRAGGPLLLGTSSSTARLFHTDTERLLFERCGIRAPGIVALAPDATAMVIGTERAEVFAIQADEVPEVGFELDHDDGLFDCTCLTQGRVLTLCMTNNTSAPLTLWNAATGKKVAVHSKSHPNAALALRDPSRYLLVNDEGKVLLLEAAKGKKIAQLYAHPGFTDEPSSLVVVEADEGRATVAFADGSVVFLDLKTCKVRSLWKASLRGIEHLAAAGDAVVAATETVLRVWDGNGKVLRERALDAPLVGLVSCAAKIALVSSSGLTLYDPTTNQALGHYDAPKAITAAVALGGAVYLGDEAGSIVKIDAS